MNTRRWSFLLSAVLLLTGCSQSSSPGSGDEVPIAMRLSIGINTSTNNARQTRADVDIQSAQFDAGETVGVYFPANVSVTNTTYTTTNSSGATTCTLATPYLLPDATVASAHGYYPVSVTQTTTSFTVQQNQNEDAAYKASDLMYAYIPFLKKDNGTVTGHLVFQHQMSKIRIRVTADKGIDTIKVIRIIGGNRTVAVSMPRCKLGTTSHPNTDTDFITVYTNGQTNKAECAFILPPQVLQGNFIQIDTNLGTATFKVIATTLESGGSYDLPVKIATSCIDAVTLITGWDDSEGESGSFEL